VVVGDFEVDALLDTEGSFATYGEAFPAAGEADWAPWRERYPGLFDGNRWLLPFRSYLIRGRGRTILVDTGVGPAGEGEFLPERQGWLPGELERLDVRPDTVFLTHVHVDHVGWNSAFDGVPFVTHRDSVALSAERGRPLPTGTTEVAGETELVPDVVAFETPGHPPRPHERPRPRRAGDPRRHRRASCPARPTRARVRLGRRCRPIGADA
jgi:glyoxylase-like metal-dependent hydrolase (beta-lactamase superfamily II)